MLSRASLAWCAIVATPAAVLAGIEAMLLLAALVDPQVRWPEYRLNLAEATAVRETAEVARQLEAGADPNRRDTVRSGMLTSAAVAATPLEAAVAIRRAELIAVLRNAGARLEPEEWRRLSCHARAAGSDDIVAALAPFGPPGAQLTCAGDEELWPST